MFPVRNIRDISLKALSCYFSCYFHYTKHACSSCWKHSISHRRSTKTQRNETMLGEMTSFNSNAPLDLLACVLYKDSPCLTAESSWDGRCQSPVLHPGHDWNSTTRLDTSFDCSQGSEMNVPTIAKAEG